MALFDGWRRLDGPEFHAIIAVVGVVGGVYLLKMPVLAAGFINAVGWYMLEAGQGMRDDKGVVPWSDRWGWRKRSELIVPIVVGSVVAAGLGVWG